jgi:hypothetical protein
MGVIVIKMPYLRGTCTPLRGYFIGGGGKVGVVTVIGRGGGGGSGGTVGTVGTVTGGGGSTGAGGTGTGTVTPTAVVTVETVEAIGGGSGEASCVGDATLLAALGSMKRVTPVTGVALRRFAVRTLAVLRTGWAWPAGALFCPIGKSGAFA